MVSLSNLSAIVDFLEQNYHYISVATQILQDAGFHGFQPLPKGFSPIVDQIVLHPLVQVQCSIP